MPISQAATTYFVCLWIIGLFVVKVNSLRTPCADQTQRCGVLVEDFERGIQDIKALAFRKCFHHPACLHEKIAFDDCYSKAIRAVRASFNGEMSPNDNFFDSSERFRAQVEHCLDSDQPASAVPPEYASFDFSDSTAGLLRETVFSTSLSDRMWLLPETSNGFNGSCVYKDFGRLYGDGISRILDSSKPAINNLNTSCVIHQEEINCYVDFLDADQAYQQALRNRDQTIAACIQGVRLQARCRGNDSPRLKNCLCEAREEFNNRLQASLLECTRKSDIGKLYEELLERGIDQAKLQKPISDDGAAPAAYNDGTDDAPRHSTRQRLHPQASTQQKTTTAALTRGSIINDQCLCSCPNSPSVLARTQNDQFVQAHTQTQPAAVQPVPVAAPIYPAQQQAIMPQNYYQGHGAAGYGGQRQPVMAAQQQSDPDAFTYLEMGISDGFNRFFKGLPPP